MDHCQGHDGPDGWPDGWGLSADEPLTGGAEPARRALLDRRCAGWRSGAAVAALSLLVVGARLAVPGQGARAPRRADGAGAEGKAERRGCLRSEKDVDYWTNASLYEISDTKSETLCAERCLAEARCGAWTWGQKRGVRGLTDVCFLKKLGKTEKPDKRKSKGVVSGLRPDSSCSGPAQVAKGAGWVKSKHGICLSAPESGVLGDKVHMSSCDIGDEDQLWTFDKLSGQIRLSTPRPSAPEGVCLTAKAGDVEYSMVLIEKCEESNGNQQWSYSDVDSQVVLWFGLCLNAPEPASDSSSVDMRECDREKAGQRWAVGKQMGRLYYDDRSYVDKELAGRYQSLFCFALMLPGSYEEKLLSWQLRENASLFACDAVAVYSNKAVSLGQGVTTRVVDSTLKCDKGGEFQTALNLPIFLAVWTKVILDGVFMTQDWTVKVDPDTVFLATRLRDILRAHPETDDGVYLNNCKFGLHGPLEVFSRNAVTAWALGSEKCVDHFTELCQGDCAWGEDMFIDQCLSRVLKLQRDSDFRMLVEDHCDPPKGWTSCEDHSYAAYHPFKNLSGYSECLTNAADRDNGAHRRHETKV